MTRRNSYVRAVLLLLIVAAPFALAAQIVRLHRPSPVGAAGRDLSCRIAMVGPIEVTIADAQKLRAFISPPLTLPEAARLAVESTAQVLAVRGHPKEVPVDPVRRLVERNRALKSGRLPAVHEGASAGGPRLRPGPCAGLLHMNQPLSGDGRLLAASLTKEGTP